MVKRKQRQFQRMLARRLHDLRVARELTQAEVAARAKMRQQVYARLEMSESDPPANPTITTLLRLAYALDVELADLLDFMRAR